MSTRLMLVAIGAAALLSANLAQSQEASEHHHHHPTPATTQDGEHQHLEDASAPTQSEREHVPPDPPAQPMHDMPYGSMARMMAMDDTRPYGQVLFDELGWSRANGANALTWDAEAFYGTDYNKLRLKSDGERISGGIEEGSVEASWERIVSRWWSMQAGVRRDFGEGPSRSWLSVGVLGLAPCFFEIDAMAYFGEQGRTAVSFEAEYDLLFTQRLILQPGVELNLYGKDDARNGVMSGFTDAEVSLRLRYEIRPDIAPYVGLAWVRHLGNTADLLRASGDDVSEMQAVAGIRFWF